MTPNKCPKRRYVRFTSWRRRRFFALLAESGNARVAAEQAGVSIHCINRLRQVEPGFAERMAAARDEAALRLRSGQAETEGLVIRRGRKGRLQLTEAGERWWTARHDAVFLGHLRATGNVKASARAAGFSGKSAWERRRRSPGFARAWAEAIAEAEHRLQGELAGMLLSCDYDEGEAEAATEAAERQPFDPWLAMWLLTRWERQRERAERAGR